MSLGPVEEALGRLVQIEGVAMDRPGVLQGVVVFGGVVGAEGVFRCHLGRNSLFRSLQANLRARRRHEGRLYQ